MVARVFTRWNTATLYNPREITMYKVIRFFSGLCIDISEVNIAKKVWLLEFSTNCSRHPRSSVVNKFLTMSIFDGIMF